MCVRAIFPSSVTPVCTWQQTYPGRDDQPRVMRADLAGFLARRPQADSVLFLINELATNAIRHSGSRMTGSFTIRVHDAPGDHVRAEVEDQGSTWTADLHASPPHHGLWFLRTMADAFGADEGSDGWIIWFRINDPPAPDGTHPAAPATGA
jgi:two-component sensor histidine kinase